jgi:hypothetical protein
VTSPPVEWVEKMVEKHGYGEAFTRRLGFRGVEL